jgi:hypothetical protein
MNRLLTFAPSARRWLWALLWAVAWGERALGAAEPVPDGEVISGRCLTLLQRVGHWIETGESAVGAEIPLELKVAPLRPEGGKERHAEPGLVVTAWSTGGAPESLAEAVGKLRGAWPKASDRHAKFKIVSVEMARYPQVTTELLFSLVARDGHEALEHHATWRATWQVDAKRGPQLVGLAVSAIEEARAPGPWLVEVTADLMRGAPEASAQMGAGNVWWRSRFPMECDQSIYGHRGLAVGDANGDGLEDVYLCMEGGLPNRLLLQNADGSVRDASKEMGVDFLEMTRAALWVDLDNDVDLDLIVSIGRGVLLLENEANRRFAPKALLPRISDAYSLAAADYDGNGTVDFYGCGYQARDADPAGVATPVPFHDAQNGGEDFLVRNEGGWRFSDATQEVGLDVGNNRFSFAAVWTDFDRDGDLDLAVANDFGKNNLFEQQRDRVGKIRFVDVAAERGMARSAFGMSMAVADFDRSGTWDFYVGNMFSSAGNRIVTQPGFKRGLADVMRQNFRLLAQGNTMWLNDGKGRFREVGSELGVAMGRWTWGTLATDLNGDGRVDLLVANGNITGHSPAPDL